MHCTKHRKKVEYNIIKLLGVSFARLWLPRLGGFAFDSTLQQEGERLDHTAGPSTRQGEIFLRDFDSCIAGRVRSMCQFLGDASLGDGSYITVLESSCIQTSSKIWTCLSPGAHETAVPKHWAHHGAVRKDASVARHISSSNMALI